MRKRILIGLVLLVVVATTRAEAQWFTFPTAGTPRLPDGKANLKAPTPRTADGKPDLSGIWKPPDGRWLADLSAEGNQIAPMTPWAAKLYKERIDNNGKDRPSATCLPHSVVDFDAHHMPKKIVQTPGVVLLLFESYHTYRQIFTDGRPLPEVLEPAWFGYSVGKWEGDTLVVDTIGIHEKTWLDDSGRPHSDQLHVTERFRRVDFGNMEVQITIDDAKAYVKPWSAKLRWQLLPDTDLLDWVCENNKYGENLPE